MFKKLLKNLSGNLEDMAKEMMESKTNSAAHQEQMKAYTQGDMQKVFETGAASAGVATPATAKEDPNDPNMQPVHGVTLFDYAAGASKIGEGCTEEQICQALGIERPIWDEAQTTWNNRMRDDSTYNVVNVYSTYFGKVKEHPKLGELRPQNAPVSDVPQEEATAHLQRLESDKYYFFEIQAAIEAAYANGMDGAQWLIDNLGLTVSQVNGTGVKYMNDFNIMAEMMDYQEEKKKEYSERFAKQNGTSGAADDIEF
jgi:hypothetical protein